MKKIDFDTLMFLSVIEDFVDAFDDNRFAPFSSFDENADAGKNIIFYDDRREIPLNDGQETGYPIVSHLPSETQSIAYYPCSGSDEYRVLYRRESVDLNEPDWIEIDITDSKKFIVVDESGWYFSY